MLQKILNGLLIIASGAMLVFAGLSYKNYRTVIDRRANPSDLALAQTPVDMLNDTPKQVTLKKDFLLIYDKVGDKAPSYKQLKQTEQDLSKIKIAHQSYAIKWRTLKQRYDVKHDFDKIFVFNKVSASPKKTKMLIGRINNNLNSLYNTNRQDKFVKDNVITVKRLNHDLKLLNRVSSELTDIASIKKHTWHLTPSANTDSYSSIYTQLSKLNYHWDYLNNFNDVQDELCEKLRNQTNVIRHYNDYLKDLQDKDNAYKDWQAQRDTRRQSYQASKQAQAQSEREEKERKQLAKQADQAQRDNDNPDDNEQTSSKSSSSKSVSHNDNKRVGTPSVRKSESNSSPESSANHKAESSNSNPESSANHKAESSSSSPESPANHKAESSNSRPESSASESDIDRDTN